MSYGLKSVAHEEKHSREPPFPASGLDGQLEQTSNPKKLPASYNSLPRNDLKISPKGEGFRPIVETVIMSPAGFEPTTYGLKVLFQV